MKDGGKRHGYRAQTPVVFAHTQICCNLHRTPQDKALKLWACIIRHVNYCFPNPKARELAAQKLWAVAASKLELVLASSVSTIKSLPACLHWSCFSE
jgi:hypothetical protein